MRISDWSSDVCSSDRRDNYTRSVTTGQKLDDQHKDSYRVSVRWTPTDNIENRLVATWFEADENGSAYKLLTVVPSVLGPTINASNLSIFPVPVRASTRGITLDGFLADFARPQNLPFHRPEEHTSELQSLI